MTVGRQPSTFNKTHLRNLENQKEIDLVRKLNGLSPLKRKNRECLRCEKKFKSNGNENRLCDRCRRAVREYVDQ